MTERRTFLFYTHSLAGGGAERAWALLASGLAKRGHKVTVAVDYQAEQNLSYVAPGVQIEILGGHHGSNIWKLSRLIRETKPDLTVSALCISNLKLVIASLLAVRLSRAVIAYHAFSGHEPQLLSRLSYALTPLQTRLAARTIAVSDALKSDLITRWKSPAKKTLRLYNPVVWGETKPDLSEADLRARAPLVLASGRLIAGKNFSMLLQAFARIENKQARLAILGDGPLRSELEAEIARLGLTGRVELAGYVAEPWDWYNRASCVVSTSQSESFGMVVVEAMAHGLPVITTPTLGPLEIIENGRYGTVVPHGDIDAVKTGIDAALAAPGDPQPRIARAREFAVDVALDSYERMTDDVIGDTPSMAHPRAVMMMIASSLGF